MERGKKVLIWLLVIAGLIYAVVKIDNKILYWGIGFIVLVYAIIIINKLIKHSDIDWD